MTRTVTFDYRKLLKVSFLVTMRIRSGMKDKYVNHLDNDELREIDEIIGEILNEDPRVVRPDSHPYLGSPQYIKDCKDKANGGQS